VESARALRWTPLADISGQIREHGILFKLWRDFQCCLVTVDRKSWAINYDDAAENKMEKNWLPNGGDNNDNGDNIYAGMVATLVRSESLCALNGTPDSDSDFSGQER